MKVFEHSINLKNQENDIHPSLPQLKGKDPKGNEFSFTNHYMVRNNHPFFGICGEFHFSRYNCDEWEDELIKMRMAGVNIVPTYVIWNHHEEIKGHFDWTGNKDLRRFILLCKKHSIDVILRIGPWDHGEARNGGFPDWLYAEPLVTRSNDKRYLGYVKNLYDEIGKQVHGLFYKDGGPIIGIQLENEFQHAGASWEITTGTSNEWIPSGSDGNEHIKTLKNLAKDAGMVAPIYTGTGWGGAVAETDTVLPLWGGYAFWPWIFYDKSVKKHPATPEYIYRDYSYPTYNFDPKYDPKEVPYAACEMGGGMTVFYSYRFKLPYQSVDAMTNVKVASGCNFVGYYVFHGGSNPLGIKTPYLNETATPKVSYDYQAVLGEFGQARPSYYRLKRQHYFFTTFQDEFCKMETVLPDGSQDIKPEDTQKLRYSVRQNDGSGYVFINNYQDHVQNEDKRNESINLKLDHEELRMPYKGGFDLDKEESCILPFNLKLGQAVLKTAMVQLITKMEQAGKMNYFFYQPQGMQPEYVFDQSTVKDIKLSAGKVSQENGLLIVHPDASAMTKMTLTDASGKEIDIYTLTTKESLNFWKFSYDNRENVLFSDSQLLVDEDGLRFESENNEIDVKAIKGLISEKLLDKLTMTKETELTSEYTLTTDKVEPEFSQEQISDGKVLLSINTNDLTKDSIKDIRLKIDYQGDIGYAFYQDKLINDNYANGRTWEIGLRHNVNVGNDEKVYISITPIRKDQEIKSDSPMAARSEVDSGEIMKLENITLTSVYEFKI